MKRSGSLAGGIAGAVVVGLLSPVAVGLTGSGAQAAGCDVESTKYRTNKGTVVWKPTNLAAGAFQRGGTQSMQVSEGEQLAKTKGSADSVGGDGGVQLGIVSAGASYNHTWNRSTTTTTSNSRSYSTTSPTLPRKKLTRWTLYHKAYRFKTTVYVTFTGSRCAPRSHSWMVVLPTKSWGASNLAWMVQFKATKNKLR